MTAKRAKMLADACADFKSGQFTSKQLKKAYPHLSMDVACNWVIEGYPPREAVRFRLYLNTVADSLEGWRVYAKTIKRQVVEYNNSIDPGQP